MLQILLGAVRDVYSYSQLFKNKTIFILQQMLEEQLGFFRKSFHKFEINVGLVTYCVLPGYL